jgi:SAM-dependent methyltransferase
VRHAAVRRASNQELVVLDVGCGNGYTLLQLALELPHCRFVGIEYNEKLRNLAGEQVRGCSNVDIKAGDVRLRDPEFAKADVVICQRVLINLMSYRDQRQALDNIVSMAKSNGHLIFVEAFASALDWLNVARKEFRLPPLKQAHHNLYLPDNFYEHSDLLGETLPGLTVQQNLLSTHYYVSRVLHAAITHYSGQTDFRNSHFVQFMSAALPDGIGNYAPLQVHCFRKRAADTAKQHS